MSITTTPELEAQLVQIAQRTGRTVQDVANEMLEEGIKYDRWFADKVATGRNQLARGEFLTHEEVGQRIERLFPAAC